MGKAEAALRTAAKLSRQAHDTFNDFLNTRWFNFPRIYIGNRFAVSNFLCVCVFDPCEEEASVLRDGMEEMTRAFGLNPEDVRQR